MEKIQRKAISDSLINHCILANKDDMIEMTEWFNGEGFDISIDRTNESKIFSLTEGEIKAIILLKNLFEADNL